MTDRKDVVHFLKNLKDASFWGYVFRDDRGKNADLFDTLKITPKDRESIIASLSVEDFSEGPLEDKLHQRGDMWVFGKVINGHEVYIKLMLLQNVLCISFHLAEHSMNYPFK